MWTIECPSCGTVIEFERHPADWPNHPDGVRVKIECPNNGAHPVPFSFFTDGTTEEEHVAALHAAIESKVRAEIAERVVAVGASDSGSGGDSTPTA